MKKILVTMRLDERQKKFLEAQAENFPCEFFIKNATPAVDKNFLMEHGFL